MEEPLKIETSSKETERPFFLTILCYAFLIFSVFIALLFMGAAINYNWVTEVFQDYFPERALTTTSILLFCLAGFILYILAATGAFLMLKLKRIGFYIYLVAILIITLIPHLLNYGSWYATGILLLLTALLALYVRKMH